MGIIDYLPPRERLIRAGILTRRRKITATTMPLNEQIAIPAHILVRCPLTNFDHRHATHCEGCEHFRGLTEQLRGPTVPFQRAYAVRCAWPVDRELFALAQE